MTGEGQLRPVLVVDDDERIRPLVRAVLGADEFEVAEPSAPMTGVDLVGEMMAS